MLKRRWSEPQPGKVGDSAIIAIPPVDRGHRDARNIIIHWCHHRDRERKIISTGLEQNRVCCEVTSLAISSKCLNFVAVDLWDIDQSRMLLIWESVSIGSLEGGQGFMKCNCSGNRKKYGTNRCKCFKNHFKCNSRCHNSLSCTNKWIKRTNNPVSIWILFSSAYHCWLECLVFIFICLVAKKKKSLLI